MPPIPGPSRPSGPSRRRKAWQYTKDGSGPHTFTFRSDGRDDVNVYDAYVGAVRRLEGRDDPMLYGYGTKVTYIIDNGGTEYREQKYAHNKKGPATRGKVVKQISQVVWSILQQQHAQGAECSPDLLKPWFLLKLERVNKSALVCVLERRQANHMPLSNATMTNTLRAFSLLSPPDHGSALQSDAVYTSSLSVATASIPQIPHSFDHPTNGAFHPPSIPPAYSHGNVQELSSNLLQNTAYPHSNAGVTNNFESATTSSTLSVVVSSVPDADRSIPSESAPADTDGPLNASELDLFRKLLGRFLKYPTAGSSDMLQHISEFATRVCTLLSSQPSPHNDDSGSFELDERSSGGHELHMQASREDEDQQVTALDSATAHESEREPTPLGDVLSDDEVSSNSDDSEFDDFDEANNIWPKPGVNPNPHRWELYSRTPPQPRSARSFVDYFGYSIVTQLFTFLRQHVPDEQLSLPATEKLEVQMYGILDLYYKPLENQRGQRNTRRQLRSYGYGYTVAARGSNERAYCRVYYFFRVSLPSGRTEDVACVRWLKSGTCTSEDTSGGCWTFDEEENEFVFISVKSIISPISRSELQHHWYSTCHKTYHFGPERSLSNRPDQTHSSKRSEPYRY